MRAMGEILQQVQGQAARPARRLLEPIGTRLRQQPASPGDPGCALCAGTGYYKLNVPPGHPDFGRIHQCGCHPETRRRMAAERAARWADSGVPERWRDWTLDYLRGRPGKEDVVAAADLILQARWGWLTLWGDPGAGKTGVGVSLVVAFLRAGRRARLVSMAKILEELRDTFHDRATECESSVQDRYAAYDLLVVDEVDRVNLTDYARTALFRVLDGRYQFSEDRATILTLNRNPEDLGPDWDYLVSRMRRAGVILHLGGEELPAM